MPSRYGSATNRLTVLAQVAQQLAGQARPAVPAPLEPLLPSRLRAPPAPPRALLFRLERQAAHWLPPPAGHYGRTCLPWRSATRATPGYGLARSGAAACPKPAPGFLDQYRYPARPGLPARPAAASAQVWASARVRASAQVRAPAQVQVAIEAQPAVEAQALTAPAFAGSPAAVDSRLHARS